MSLPKSWPRCNICGSASHNAPDCPGKEGGQMSALVVESRKTGGDMKSKDPLVKTLYEHKNETEIPIPNEDLARRIGVRTKTLQRLFNGQTKRMSPLMRHAVEEYLAKQKQNGGSNGR